MQDSYYELLAFRDLPTRVEELFRAFLDVMLIEFASKDIDDYPKKVAAFRRGYLSACDFGKLDEALASPAGSAAAVHPTLTSEQKKNAERAAQFLYWYDVRAQYWQHEHEKAAKLQPELVSGKKLEMLYEDAERLRKRIENRGAAGKPKTPAPSGSPAPDPEKDQMLWFLKQIKASPVPPMAAPAAPKAPRSRATKATAPAGAPPPATMPPPSAPSSTATPAASTPSPTATRAPDSDASTTPGTS